jgi:hypothetical protein
MKQVRRRAADAQIEQITKRIQAEGIKCSGGRVLCVLHE